MKNRRIFCDVLVVGAGISGIAAAISASRRKAKTILLEQNSLPGGIAADCRHRYLCGLPFQNTGITKEILQTLQRLSPKNKFTRIGKLPVFYFKPEDLDLTLRQLIKKEKSLKVFYNCRAISVQRVKNIIFSVRAIKNLNTRNNPAGSLPAAQKAQLKLCFNPQSIIDASGQGIVIKFSEAHFKLAALKSRQLAGFTFEVQGIRDPAGLLPIKIPYSLAEAVKQKKIPAYFKLVNFSYGQTKTEGIIKLNLPASDTYRGSKETRKYAFLIFKYFRNTLPEFKNSRMRYISSQVHEREGLRLSGEHTLTQNEILNAKKIPQPAVQGCWPIEFWHPKLGQKIKYLPKFYQIPLGCLKSKNIKNLLATGKCISATPQALASSRVMGTCIYLGEAAGKAAVK